MSVTLENLRAEYTQLCTEYGDITLQLEALQQRAGGIKRRVDELAKLQQELLAKKEQVEVQNDKRD